MIQGIKVQFLVDNPNSWIIPYAKELCLELNEIGCYTGLVNNHEEIKKGDILVLLGCEKKFTNLELNKHNLVVHESDLPLGKGWSPLTWQVLEGKKIIPVTLFEAVNEVDSGDIYAQKKIFLDGSELLKEIKQAQGIVTKELIHEFIREYPKVQGRAQEGETSFYHKRTYSNNELDVNKSIKEQFDLLRVCDNDRYPAHFRIKNNEYVIKIYRRNNE